MTAISWKNPVNGDWNVASNWSTDTVPTLNDDVTISASGPYIVAVGAAFTIPVGPLHLLGFPIVNSLTFNAPEAALQENVGSLSIMEALTVDSGLVSLNEANSIGAVALAGGALAFGNGAALGTGAVSMSGGELLATANETLSNALIFSGASTIAAAHGTTLNENASSFVINANSTLNFGALGQDGVVIWRVGPSVVAKQPFTFNVVAGTLKAGDNGLAQMINFGLGPTTVDAGAILDLGGFGLSLNNLLGGGTVTDSGAAATLTLNAANFSGAISGPLSLDANGAVVLSGANTYTGTTTINSGASLQIGAGGTGSVGAGAISDAGTLSIDASNAIALASPISGVGVLNQIGTGVTAIGGANAYTGGTTLSAGTLAIGNGAALGTGTVSMTGGELLGTANEIIANALNIAGTSTIAAAHGTTLNQTGFVNIAGGSTLNFGALGQDGVVNWAPAGYSVGAPITVDVVAGTLKAAGDLPPGIISFGAQPTTVDPGATFDLGGFSFNLANLLGGGTITDSGAATTLTLGAANFSGTIAGALSVDFNGNASLSGLEDMTGGATLNGPVTVANTGTYDIVANTSIAGTPVSSFINNGLFEKTGGGGASDVTSNFVNNGTLNVLSGSIAFSGGFANHGVIHGLVRQSGGVTTISAPVPSDFNGDGLSDILWQNTDGQAAIWEINGTSQIPGGSAAVEPDPGPGWTEIGTGDFNGDGHSDILFQNTNGQAAIWEMNGTSVIGGGTVSPNPGPGWKAIGTGDFNGDGLADILWQNANGQAAIWEMNGTNMIGGGAVSPNPGPTWQAIGTGDFNGDGHSDILWQNANGQTAIWEMDGSNVVGGGNVNLNAGPGWQAIGTGDFNGDGRSDILFQNPSSGQVAIWEMNGTNVIGGGTVGAIPGPSWRAIGTGDFNGDGFSDIQWQNQNGQAEVWEMNGINQIPGGSQLVGANPGSSWHEIKA